MPQTSGSEETNWIGPFSIEAIMELQRPTLTAMAEANTKLYESIAAANREWASFVNRRLKEDLAVPHQLAGCKNFHDLYAVYAQFFQNACSQYQSELEQMTKLGQSMAQNAFQALQSSGEKMRKS
jgi:phasin protein